MNRIRLALSTVIVGLALVAGAGPLRGQSVETAAPMAAAAQIETFEKEVRPLLVARCYKCHAAEAKRVRGNLRLDTRGACSRGATSARRSCPATPTEPAHPGGPPRRPRPADAARGPAHAGRDRDAGEVGPRGDAHAAGCVPRRRGGRAHAPRDRSGEWWAFRPAREPEVPAVRDESWPRNAARPLHPGRGWRRPASGPPPGRPADADPPRRPST